VWKAADGQWDLALTLWAAQLVLNSLWTYFFFRRHRIGLALLDIAALLAVIVLFMFETRDGARVAALLFAPYAAWIAFATVLNAAIWELNPRRTTAIPTRQG
jgi:tryptophan-rich sensory protein